MTGPGVRLRPTRESDLDYVLAAETHPDNAPWVGSWTRDEHRAFMSFADADHWIIEENDTGAPVGFIMVLDLQSIGRGAHIKRMVVTEGNRGIGRAALAECCHRAFADRGAPFVWLDVMIANRRAQAAYRAAGFRERDCAATEFAEWAACVGGFDEPSVLMFREAATGR